jgi:hypothetical protein
MGPGQSRAVCLYCNSTIRVETGQPDSTAEVATTLDEADMARLKQLLLDGQRQLALELYRQKTGDDPAAAEQALDNLAGKFSMDVIRRQQLNSVGIAQAVVNLLILLAGIVLWVTGTVHWLVGLVLILFGGSLLLFIYPALLSTIKFGRGKPATAHVQKMVPVGTTKFGRLNMHIFKLLVDVQPANGDPAYQAELLLPVREQNLRRAQVGTDLRVKYLPQDPQQVIYDE